MRVFKCLRSRAVTRGRIKNHLEQQSCGAYNLMSEVPKPKLRFEGHLIMAPTLLLAVFRDSEYIGLVIPDNIQQAIELIEKVAISDET